MLKYSVSMEEPNSHYLEVVIDILEFRGKLGPKPIRVVMPTWTPGSYLIREFSRNVLDLVAFDIDEDEVLETKKVSKNEWEIDPSKANSVRVKYRVYAFEYTVDTSYMDNLHAIINGASVFMYVEGFQGDAFQLTVIPPDDWKTISTSLERVAAKNHEIWTLAVPNFDTLVDSPIEVGNQTVHDFQVQGVKYEVSIFTQREFDELRLVNDLKKIVETALVIFSHVPYNRYVFVIDISAENAGGLEHSNSTHCIAPMYRLEPLQEYKQLLSLFSHEFFHAWNVKRMRPVGLGPFNYVSETYTKSLWIAEGITSYYDDLILRRAGIYSVAEYLDALSTNFNIVKSLPGRKWQSAEQSSFDTWIKQYRPNENTPNAQSSYYYQGAVVGWMLDLQIRKSTGLKNNLDDALRRMYSETYLKQNRAYGERELETICSQFIGPDEVERIFEMRIRGRKEVDFDARLEDIGLKLWPKKRQEDLGFLGVKTQQEGGKLLVSTVLSDTPAQECGLAALDEIIAIDGIRMDSSKLSWYVSNRKPETPIRLLISRFGTLLEFSTETILKPTLEYKIVKLEKVSSEQKALFKSWLAEEWDAEIRYEEYTSSPSKRNLFEYV